ALTPNTFWVDLKQVDFSSETGSVRRLDLGKEQDHTYAGNATADFTETAPFRFMGL
ncbi:MAG TPA: choloylglycine hydrolase, partial [Pseudomonas sp.]|nr:choloylglycine hydrolase [Pseudomonas sp.]